MKKLMEITEFAVDARFFLNGEEAVKDLSQRDLEKAPLPDLILLDINMPIMNGWQFLDKCCEWDSVQQCSIFVVSSSINKEEIDKATSYPFVDGYILKPMTLDKIKDLKNKIQALI
jgi:CheY-like chemotaxis protein